MAVIYSLSKKNKPDPNHPQVRQPGKGKELIGKVVEILSLRSKEEGAKLQKLLKKRKTLKLDDFEDKLKQTIDIDDVEFNTRPVRQIHDIGKILSLYKPRVYRGEDPSSQLYVTNSGSVMFIDKEMKKLYYNELDIYTINKSKLGFIPGTRTKNDINTMNWAFTDDGALGYSSEEIYFLSVINGKDKADKPDKISKIDFKINQDRLFIKSVVGCPDSRYILITLSTIYEELVLLIWDLKTNSEVINYSLETEFSYIGKPGNQYGIVLTSDFYINLDLGLINYYFDHGFSKFPWTSQDQGYKMDKNETTILYKGKLLMKEMYSENEVLQSLLDGRTIYNERTENDKLSAHQMLIQIEGNTILHLYSVDFIPLSLMLSYMEKRKPNMLNSILMKNNKGQTPIDLAIKFESMKTINLLLLYLAKLKDASFSRLLQSKFNKLLSMNLISFHSYLDSCFFQTIQMKGIKFLDLKQDYEKQVFTHKSCLIDESFLKLNTNEEVGTSTVDDKKASQNKSQNQQKEEMAQKSRADDYRVEAQNAPHPFEQSDEPDQAEIEIPDSDEVDEESEIVDANNAFSGNDKNNAIQADSSRSDKSIDEDDEEDEGGEDESKNENEEEKGQDPNQVIVRKEDIDPNPYDPAYNIFTTENRNDTVVRDGDYSEDPLEMDDYYRRNAGSNEDSIRQMRSQRLVPKNEVLATEKEEARLQKFEEELKSKHSLSRLGTKKLSRQFKDMKTVNTKNLTKEELAQYREQERAEYYRQNIKNNMPVLDITAIEFDWLFGEQGAAFVRTMADTDSIELFSIGIIQEIIGFFWGYYRIRIVLASLLPFVVNFLVFAAYTTYLKWDDDDHGDDTNHWRIYSYVCMGLTLFFALYFLIFEILYFSKKGLSYLVSFWSIINLLSIGLNIATVVIDFTDLEKKYFIPVASSAIIIMWLKLFYYGRIFDQTSTIVRMIIEISKDMVPFLIIVFTLLFGFTNAFFIIADNVKGTQDMDCRDDDGNEFEGRFTGKNLFLALTYTWQQGLGEFNTDQFCTSNFEEFVFILWIFCTFFFLMVFLNLLIAVLSDSFDKIQETLENNLLKEQAIMMKDNEILLNRKKVFKDVKYLILIEKVLVTDKSGSWGGKLDYVNRIIKRTRNTHFRLIDKIMERTGEFLNTSLDYRIGTMEQTTDKSLNYIVDKIDRLDQNVKMYKDIFLRVMALR